MISRLKFEISNLVNQILDQFPPDIWTSTTTTFLDPAIGGGQFVREIERRLAAAGHSADNIHSRVFGYEEYEHRVRYAVNKHRLKGTYARANFLEMEHQMKFDAIVGNPPFQANDADGERKQLSHNLYSLFVQKGLDLTKDSGYIGMVIPTSWMTPIGEQSKSAKVEFKSIFKTYNLILLNINECAKYFGVGSNFTYFVLEKDTNKRPTSVVCKYNDTILNSSLIIPDNATWVPNLLTDVSLNLVSRLMWNNSAKLPVMNDNFFHPVVNKTYDRQLYDAPTDTHVYPQFHTNAKDRWSDIPHKNQYSKKVLFSKSGYVLPAYDDGIKGTTDAGFWIEVDSSTSGNNLIAVLNSTLYRFLLTINKWSGFNMPAVVQSLPYVDWSRPWTDKELYTHFNLTPEEIEYVESNTK